VSVFKRYRYEPGHGSWTLYPPTKGTPGWSTYGSFWEAADGRDGDTEYEALQVARRRLRRVAPALLKRLDFDQESSGTGVIAHRRRDLVRALEILGIR
jgi:hypothetical protein